MGELTGEDRAMYKLSFFVPPSHVEEVKSAVFAAVLMKCGSWLIFESNAVPL
jgi:hypothetical protein